MQVEATSRSSAVPVLARSLDRSLGESGSARVRDCGKRGLAVILRHWAQTHLDARAGVEWILRVLRPKGKIAIPMTSEGGRKGWLLYIGSAWD